MPQDFTGRLQEMVCYVRVHIGLHVARTERIETPTCDPYPLYLAEGDR